VCASGIRQLFPTILLIGKSEMPVLGKIPKGASLLFFLHRLATFRSSATP